MEIVTFYPEDDSDLEVNAGLSLDIIAIHGLNGNQINTWTEPKSKKLWLRDFLPKDLPGARVMTFGYNAAAAFGNSVAEIRDHARGLLGELIEKRERSFEVKRPLIFIGHSLGGLVIKQALVIAEKEPSYKQIYNSTLGIIFFGTPHQGSSLANYATTITRTLLVLANKPNAELLESLRKGSPALKQLEEDWKAHHERRPYGIVSFYETRTMKGMRGLIVEKSSALLTPQDEVPTWEDQIPVEATHRDMCRFATPKDKTYKTFVRKIKRIQQGSSIKVKNEFYVVPHSSSTHFTGRNGIREQLSDSLLSYRTSKAQQIFILYGLGGSGKTQIALKFAEDNRDCFWGIFWIDASSKDTAQEGFLSIARACKQEENVESVKAWLSRKDHWLLILDNADNPDLDIAKFFPSRERGTILITTRNPDLKKYKTAGSCEIDRLNSKDALALLLKTAAVEDSQDENVRQVAKRIVNELGCLALAIIQAGAVIRQGLCSLDGFCDVYSKQKREILESGRSIPSTENYQYSVFTTWEISIEKIEEITDDSAKLALELLRMFSFMHFDGIHNNIFKNALENSMYAREATVFRSSLLAKLMVDGWNGLLWGKAMKLLLAFSLVTTSHSGVISMHPLVHLWTKERMSAPERLDAWKTTMTTLGISITQYPAGEQQRRLLLPHIDSLHEYGNDQFFAPVPDNPKEGSTAIMNFHLAYAEGRQFQKALRIARADFELKKRILDPKDADFLISRYHVGANLQLIGRYRESAEWLEHLIEDIPENIDYTIYLNTAVCLARSYSRLEEYRSSFELCTKAMAKFEDIFAGEPPEPVALYNAMGEALCGLKRPKEALIWTTKAVLGAQKVFGAEHSITILATEYLANVYAGLKDFQKACEWQEKCVNCLKDNLGTDHPATISAEEALIDYFTQRRMNLLRRRKFIGRRKALFDKMNQQFGEKDWRTLDCQSRLAHDYFACSSLKKAMLIQEKWVEVMTQEFGQDDKRTMEGIAALAWTNHWILARKALYWWLPQRFLK